MTLNEINNKMKLFEGTPFKIITEKIDNGQHWNYKKVSIYNNDLLIGDYIRNYPDHALETFYPFKIEDDWYALYSKNYSSLSVMKLTDKIEHWCDYSDGFCPVEVYIPSYNEEKCSFDMNGKNIEYNYYSFDNEDYEEEEPEFNQYCQFGLVSGCVWGDDSSWKIRYIDLTHIKDQELNITEKFGYWEQPNTLTLKQSIDLRLWDKEHPMIKLYKEEIIKL